MTKRYTVERGAYYGTTDDRADRWYVRDGDSDTVDRRGPGYATRAEARDEADRLNAAVTDDGPTCDMVEGCTAPVTMIGSKGYVYCPTHGRERRASGRERVRKMTPAELRRIRAGEPLERY